MRLRLVTTNPGKLAEARAVLAGLGVEVEPADVAVLEIQADTLEEVARFKANALGGRVEPPYFVEDAGLFVDALSGFPGVYSAHALATIGWRGLLRLLGDTDDADRSAHFKAVIGYVDAQGAYHEFRGRVDGRIARQGSGSHGFGFDPVFIPQDGESTFAQMTAGEKNRASHRARALAALAGHLARQQKR
jgi:XTP/dITP diphosphohydrolase